MNKQEFKETVDDYLKDTLGLIRRVENSASSNGKYDLIITPYAPYPGVTVFATIGIMDHISRKEGGYNLYCEIIGAAYTEFPRYKESIKKIVSILLKKADKLHESSLLTNVLEDTNTNMQSIFLTHPFIFDGMLDYFSQDKHGIGWLMAVPITKKEENFLQTNGVEALESLFEKYQIDIFNLNRPSVV